MVRIVDCVERSVYFSASSELAWWNKSCGSCHTNHQFSIEESSFSIEESSFSIEKSSFLHKTDRNFRAITKPRD